MKKLAIILMLSLLTGCMTTGRKFDDSNVSKIQKGITTRDQIVQMFGPPLSSSVSSDGASYIYQFTKSAPDAATFMPIVGMFHTGVNTDTKLLSIFFDDKNIVKSYSLTNTAMPVNSGLIP